MSGTKRQTVEHIDQGRTGLDPDSKNSLRAWLYLLKCAKSLEREISDRFRSQFKSSLSRFDVLAHLDLAGSEGLSTSQLAGRLLASKGNITRLLDRMEQDGLITRRQEQRDRRISRIHLSANGADLFGRMAPVHERWCHDLFSHIDTRQKEQLVRLLRTVKRDLDAQS
jgi:DNA-binding MarR family transcriptional regulator